MVKFDTSSRHIGTIAISQISVYQSKRAAPELHESLVSIAGSIKERPGCIAYDVTESSQEKGLWIVTGHWNSYEAMEEHFEDPALGRFADLVMSNAVSRLDFNSRGL